MPARAINQNPVRKLHLLIGVCLNLEGGGQNFKEFKASLGLQETLIQNTKTKSWVWWLLGVVVHAFDHKAKFRGTLVSSSSVSKERENFKAQLISRCRNCRLIWILAHLWLWPVTSAISTVGGKVITKPTSQACDKYRHSPNPNSELVCLQGPGESPLGNLASVELQRTCQTAY